MQWWQTKVREAIKTQELGYLRTPRRQTREHSEPRSKLPEDRWLKLETILTEQRMRRDGRLPSRRRCDRESGEPYPT
jgi:hypothetical protein